MLGKTHMHSALYPKLRLNTDLPDLRGWIVHHSLSFFAPLSFRWSRLWCFWETMVRNIKPGWIVHNSLLSSLFFPSGDQGCDASEWLWSQISSSQGGLSTTLFTPLSYMWSRLWCFSVTMVRNILKPGWIVHHSLYSSFLHVIKSTTLLSSLWYFWVTMVRNILKPPCTSALPSCTPPVISTMLPYLSSPISFPPTQAQPGQLIHSSFCSRRLRMATYYSDIKSQTSCW